ncbi:hypothetical protein H4R26_005181, partial [Coemansia thaxteri]
NTFPVSIKTSAATINGIHTDVAVLGFTNCVVVIITQLASVASIIQAVGTSIVTGGQGTFDDAQAVVEHLASCSEIPVEVKFVLGNSSATATCSLYQALATHIFQHRRGRDPMDSRPLTIGIGLDLPREFKLPLYEDSISLPQPGGFMPVVDAIAALVDDCFLMEPI